jgi:hypothetical protein
MASRCEVRMKVMVQLQRHANTRLVPGSFEDLDVLGPFHSDF